MLCRRTRALTKMECVNAHFYDWKVRSSMAFPKKGGEKFQKFLELLVWGGPLCQYFHNKNYIIT